VNLFVGIARERRLNPFYVEVTDLQRWNYRDGVVVSQGHIVAGMYVDGELSTFDFLPYQTKAYRDFKPITDLMAVAHYYNNLGAEALLDDDVDRALPLLETAVDLAPGFDKALNNYGVVLLRLGRTAEAMAIYEKALATDPENVALLTNLVRTYQLMGRTARANELLAELETLNQSNPYLFVYLGEQALARGEIDAALAYMAQALRRDSDVAEVHLGLAKVYLAMGELKKARHHVERSLKLDATNSQARAYAAIIERGPSDVSAQP
jgi:tetratricopeptide (TPR) repeat protein